MAKKKLLGESEYKIKQPEHSGRAVHMEEPDLSQRLQTPALSRLRPPLENKQTIKTISTAVNNNAPYNANNSQMQHKKVNLNHSPGGVDEGASCNEPGIQSKLSSLSEMVEHDIPRTVISKQFNFKTVKGNRVEKIKFEKKKINNRLLGKRMGRKQGPKKILRLELDDHDSSNLSKRRERLDSESNPPEFVEVTVRSPDSFLLTGLEERPRKSINVKDNEKNQKSNQEKTPETNKILVKIIKSPHLSLEGKMIHIEIAGPHKGLRGILDGRTFFGTGDQVHSPAISKLTQSQQEDSKALARAASHIDKGNDFIIGNVSITKGKIQRIFKIEHSFEEKAFFLHDCGSLGVFFKLEKPLVSFNPKIDFLAILTFLGLLAEF